MGSAIQYCMSCGEQIPAKDVSDGRAVQRGDGFVCATCVKKAGIPAASPPARTPTPPPRRSPKGVTSTIRPPAARAGRPSAPSQVPLPLIFAGGAVTIIALILSLVLRSSSSPEPFVPTPHPAPQTNAQVDRAKAQKAAEEAKARASDAAAQQAFDEEKAQADLDESDGQIDMALSEWDAFPRELLTGRWLERVTAERRRLGEAKVALEKEAEGVAKEALRQAAALADQQKYDEALAELGRFNTRFKRTSWADPVSKARTRYEEAQKELTKRSTDAVGTAGEQCYNVLRTGDRAGARKVWEALLGDPKAGAAAKAGIESLAKFDAETEKEGVGGWTWRNHILLQPRGGAVWDGQTLGNILVHRVAELDGARVVLIGIDGKQGDAGYVVCLQPDGKKKWDFETSATHWNGPPKQLSVAAIEVADLDGDGKREVITVSNSVGLYPCRVCVLTSDGKLRSEFWNPGHGGKPFVCELDGDSKPEVLCSFVNNDMGMMPTLACFHGSDIRGQAPPGGTGTYVWYVKVPEAKLALDEVTFARKGEKGPVEQILCRYQNGLWVLDAGGNVIKKQ